MRDISDLAVAAIQEANDPPNIFRFGTALARVRSDLPEMAIEVMSVDALKGLLDRVADFMKSTKDGLVPARPPQDVVKDLLTRPDLDLPRLDRIVRAPVVSACGTIDTSAGYSHASRTYLLLPDGIKIPEIPQNPSGSDLESARKLLSRDLLGDFPFVGDADRANAMALLLLPFARELIDGPTPLHLIDAPSPGSGKTLLAQVLLAPSVGGQPSVLTEGRDEDEWRKRVTSALMRAPTAIVFDNLRRPLDSSAVASVLTAHVWSDRQLGLSKMVSLPVRTVWVATGNGITTSGEIARRSVLIRLDSEVERPWERSGFLHPNLQSWARANRGRLIWAALTIIRAWVAARAKRLLARLSRGRQR
jgi:hypothetical protein